jgi:hypothetical protein
MRRLLLLSAILLIFPAVARPDDNPPPPPPPLPPTTTATPVLTLKAPGATTYGHRIDFVGRLSPAARGDHVRLLRGSTFVADAYTTVGGSYRIQVAIAHPGPFRAEAAGVASKPVTVRIVPFLQAALVGPMVAGNRLALRARLQPTYAGSLRVRVQRSGGRQFQQVFGPTADIALGTTEIESFRVVVDVLPRPGFTTVSRTIPVQLRPPSLTIGSRSPLIAQVLRRLGALGYEVPGIRQAFDSDVLESVYAFEKVQSVDRTGIVDGTFWSRLDRPRLPRPRYLLPASHIEVDKTHQVLYVVRSGQVKLISPVSTAGISGYFTPVGRFAIYRKVPGYDPSPLGILYKPMYFTGGYAIHGNPSVPPYPASHGCIRVPNFVIERLYRSEPYGETVYVY